MLKYFVLLVLAIITTLADEAWEDTPETTLVWQLISTGQNQHLHQFFIENPRAMMMRSGDGRGALWWAWEYKNSDALAVLGAHGVDLHYTSPDAEGNQAKDLCDDYETVLNEAQQKLPEKKQEKVMIEEAIRQEKEKMMASNDDDLDSYDEEEDDEAVEDDDYDESDFEESGDNEFFHDEI